MTACLAPVSGTMTIKVSRKQLAALTSQAEYTLFCAGVGSGKTKAGGLWAAREMCRCSGVGLVGANTFKQLNRVTLKAFLAQLAEMRIPYVFGSKPPRTWGQSPFPSHEMIVSAYVAGQLRQVICTQLGSFDYLRGIEIRWFWCDETRDTPKEAFDVLMARKRGGPRNVPRPALITTTPAGFDWLYDCFISHGEAALSNRAVIYSTSHDNPWLPPGYVDSLLKNYSPRLAKQEVMGQFVSLAEGQAYSEFQRSTHVSDEFDYDPAQPLIHTWDFNVNPLCSCILQVDPKSGCVYIIDEIHIMGSARTRDATEEFVRRYGQHESTVKVYGDSSGSHRGTSNERTDFQIIEDEYNKAFGPRAMMCANYRRNPSVADSVQDVNSLLLNAQGTVRLKVHPRCEYTIRDLEQVVFKPGTREIDKTDPVLTHHSDALRYYVTPVWPARSEKVRAGSFGNW